MHAARSTLTSWFAQFVRICRSTAVDPLASEQPSSPMVADCLIQWSHSMSDVAFRVRRCVPPPGRNVKAKVVHLDGCRLAVCCAIQNRCGLLTDKSGRAILRVPITACRSGIILISARLSAAVDGTLSLGYQRSLLVHRVLNCQLCARA